MHRLHRRVLELLVVLTLGVGVVSGCGERVDASAEVAVPADTLTQVGRRLSQTRSIADLTTIAAQGRRVLAELTPEERDALGRGHLQVEVDRPAVVEVAADPGAVPFWLDDLGFTPTNESIEVRGETWPLYRRRFEAGLIGLGVNALDRAAAEHYVPFFRAEDGGRLTVRAVRPDRWRSTLVAAGVSAVLDAHVPLQRIPTSLRGATLLQIPYELRHATPLARGRIWKTHVASGPTPDQVTVAFGADPRRELVWNWRTSPDVRSTAVRLAPAPASTSVSTVSSNNSDGSPDPRSVRQWAGESDLVRSPDLLNDPVIRRHVARVSDLKPGATYLYSVGDGSPAGWSPWRTIRTGPDQPDHVQFLYLGDAQCGFEGWGRLLHAAAQRHPNAGFLLLAGDLVDRGNERTNWDHFFLRASGVFDRLPLMPCVGNHEYLDQGPRLYRAFFEPPRNGPPGIDSKLVYAFEYGDAFVAVLDSNLALADRRLARLQAEWLDKALSRTKAGWTFVMFHHPIYASHPWRLNPTLLEDWVPTFDKHHVDLVLQGHDHAYLRTYPMRGDQRMSSNAEGTTYVVSVSGEKFCEQTPRDYTELGLTNVSTYQTIDIDVPQHRLTYRAWDLEGRELDRLVIEKRRSPSLALSQPDAQAD